MPGHKCLSQDCLPPPTKGGKETKIVSRINAEALRAVRKVREREVGRNLTKSPRRLVLNASNTLTNSSTKCYLKDKMPNVGSKSSLDVFPHATSHTDVHGRTQRPRF